MKLLKKTVEFSTFSKMKRNQFHDQRRLAEATPDRRDTDSKFRTPQNQSAANVAEWSPIVRFATPNLDSPSLDVARTPAMLASLGIGQEPSTGDVSWRSCMATPSAADADMPGTSVYLTPQETGDQDTKVSLESPLVSLSIT